MEPTLAFLTSFAAIFVINLLLSGDNAIVIALAARNVPQRLQSRAIAFGTVGAVVVRVVMTLAVVRLLQIPGLLFVGGVALIWIGYKLLIPDEELPDDAAEGDSSSMWGAIRTIVIADMVMGFDNVIGVAGAAHGSYALVILGLVTSIPIVVWGSTWLLKWVERHPVIVYFGAAVLLWTAAKMIASDPLSQGALSHTVVVVLLYASVIGGVLLAGFLRNHRKLQSRIYARITHLSETHSLDPNVPFGGPMKIVLVPVSDQPHSLDAVERIAAEHPNHPDMQLHIMNVRRPLSRRVAGFVRPSLREDYHRQRAEMALAPARAILDKHGISYVQHMRVGDPGTLIADEARRLSCDRIVMSTARHGTITRILEDSTTERVLQATRVPVELIVSSSTSPLERWGVPAAIVTALAAIVAAALVAD